MIVPKFWAEASVQGRVGGRNATVRRFGWSDESEAAAQAHAQQRATEACARLVAGERLQRRELKRPYNGAEGVPIREEIVAHHGTAVITRNAYGALCLNTPDVLFADIDFPEPPAPGLGCVPMLLLFLAGAGLGRWMHSGWIGIGAAVLLPCIGQAAAWAVARLRRYRAPDPEQVARVRVESFVAAHPDWRVRLYRTPAGLRMLAMHRVFDPAEAAVAQCFAALGADPIYVRMCLNQHCFRARVSPKPWRIGIGEHMRPRPGVWPVKFEHMARRQRWISAYEQVAAGYAACRFVAELGSGAVDAQARAVQALHDELCRVQSELPLA